MLLHPVCVVHSPFCVPVSLVAVGLDTDGETSGLVCLDAEEEPLAVVSWTINGETMAGVGRAANSELQPAWHRNTSRCRQGCRCRNTGRCRQGQRNKTTKPRIMTPGFALLWWRASFLDNYIDVFDKTLLILVQTESAVGDRSTVKMKRRQHLSLSDFFFMGKKRKKGNVTH